MATYSTPGVFVEEISTFPPSVAEVSTAVPAFIGYTKQGLSVSEGPKTLRINTLLEFEAAFGKAPASQFTLSPDYDADNGLWNLSSLARTAPSAEYLLHYCLDMYFKNGGGSCYIISIGNYLDIRAFTGKRTLVWDAAGNDNEWRYVSVRRLFNMIEESSRKATAFAVFEPNDATTWLKVKAMIESYLFNWQVAAANGLNNFRRLLPGQEIVFPPIEK